MTLELSNAEQNMIFLMRAQKKAREDIITIGELFLAQLHVAKYETDYITDFAAILGHIRKETK